MPEGGFVPLEQRTTIGAYCDDRLDLPAVEDPALEGLFYREWIESLVLRVLSTVREACEAKGKTLHYTLFQQHVVELHLPLGDNWATKLSLAQLAAHHGLDPKTASNHIGSVKRAFRRALLQEISKYAISSGDAMLEAKEAMLRVGIQLEQDL